MGENYTHDRLIYAIYMSKIAPYVPNTEAHPDWNKLALDVQPYGQFGREIWLRARLFHYKNKKDYSNWILAAEEYLKEYPAGVDDAGLNNWAWDIFTKSQDKEQLKFALGWSKRTFTKKTEDKIDPNHMDTYANILYKLGKTTKAIQMEKRVIDLATKRGLPDLAVFQGVLAKMQAGQPTWPDK